MTKYTPPRMATWLLMQLLDPHVMYSGLGDFEERFHARAKDYGLLRAQLFYWAQVFILIPPFVRNLCYWSLEMIKNYLKVATRILKRHKAYSSINILGLAIGMASCLLILLYI